jgi:hypothetical protein
MNQDHEHLKLLSIFHYVVGGLSALFACIPLLHMAMGIAMVAGAFDDTDPVLPFMGWFFIFFSGAIVLAGWAFAVLVILAGRALARRERYTFCLVMAAVQCVFMPFGTVLGVFTILVLVRPSVKELFGLPEPEATS